MLEKNVRHYLGTVFLRKYYVAINCENSQKRITVFVCSLIRAWPNIDIIDPKWKGLQDPLFETVCSENVIYTPRAGGRWLKVEEAIFDRLDDSEVKELLPRILLEANENIASLPVHALKAICVYATISNEISPSLVLRVLKGTPPCYRNLCRIEKLRLLKFILNGKDTKYADLVGLELLPTASGVFTSFSNVDEAIYISSPEHPRELLPGLQHRILDQEIDNNLFRSLEAVAKEGMNDVVDSFPARYLIWNKTTHSF